MWLYKNPQAFSSQSWQISFLADRTNGRAIATLLRLSSVCLSVCDVMYCGYTVRPRAKVTIESL